MPAVRRALSVTSALVLAASGLLVVNAPLASAAVSCSGSITWDHTYKDSAGNPIAELTIYYNSSNGGTNSACLYHRGSYYGKTEPTAVQMLKCQEADSAAGSQDCTVIAKSSADVNNYAYYAGPRGVTGTDTHCVVAIGDMELTNGTLRSFNSGTQGCPGIPV